MKNLTRIFTAIVVVLVSYSCVTDTTSDLGVQVGNGEGQTTTLPLSLEGVRTQLGEKTLNEEGESIYPLYWSEGDAIAVNGQASYALEGVEEKAVSAIFSFAEGIGDYPYNIVYPAPAEGVTAVTEGCYPVVFPTTQQYVPGNLDPNAVPMYGYAANEEAGTPTLNLLTGVLRIPVKGAVTLTSATVKALGGNIAGTYDVNCKTGELVAQDGATNSVTMSFGEAGLPLSNEAATPLYVAVPAGNYGEMWITLRTATDKMTIKFNSDVKPISAAKVREFKEITYQANEGDTDDSVFEIDSKEALIEFARIASVFAPRTKAHVTATEPIDMTGYEWKPIEGFGEYEFDGGEVEIKGLNAPLFGSTAATIKNVKLTDVNITITDRTQAGAIACNLTGAAMTNCSAAGTMVVNNTTFTTTASMKNFDVIDFGGLVGIAGGVAFENCENRVNVTITSVSEAEQTGEYIAVGGAVGAAHSKSSFNNVDNHGAVTLGNQVSVTATSIGGVIGYMAELGHATPEVTVVKNCDNHGKISTDDAALVGETQPSFGTLKIGGICANMVVNMEDFSYNNNLGAIHHVGYAGTVYMGGIIGSFNLSAVANCTNNASITNSGRFSGLFIGGIVACDVMAAITNCTNDVNGDILQEATLEDGVSASANVYIGGISGSNEEARTAHSNRPGKEVTDFDPTANAISGCYNRGDLTLTGYVHSVFLGGLVARKCYSDISNCHNEGNISHTGTQEGNFYVSGICGLSTTSITGSTNSGNICINGKEALVLTSSCHITGIAGSAAISNCSNSGDISVDNLNQTSKSNMYVCGIATTPTNESETSSCDNSGNISVGENATITAQNEFHVHGCFYQATSKLTGCDNSGNITIGSKAPARPTYVSGVVYDAQGGVEECTNSGNITVGGSEEVLEVAGKCHITGIVNTVTGVLSGCKNSGDITVKGINQTASENMNVFGVALTIDNDVSATKDCDNEGNISVGENGTITKAGGSLYIGGCLGTANSNIVEDCDNSGSITVGTGAPACGTHVSGVAYKASVGILDCTNSGAITVKGNTQNTTTSVGVNIGGVVNNAYGYISECENLAGGVITVQDLPKMTLQLGAVVTNSYVSSVTSTSEPWSSNYNYAAINVSNVGGWTGDTSFRVGGLVANTTTSGTLSATNQAIFKDSANNGNITVSKILPGLSKTTSGYTYRTLVTGCFPTFSSGPNVIDNVDNNGTISVDTYASSNTYVGGVIGYWGMSSALKDVDVYIKNCDNTKPITVTCSKAASGGPTAGKGEGFLIGGVIAGNYSNAALGHNIQLSDLTNSGKISLSGDNISDATSRHQIAGIIADCYSYGVFTRCYNEGEVEFDGKNTSISYVEIGGVVARHRPHNSQSFKMGTYNNCVNAGKISIKNYTVNNYLYAAGLLGYDYNTTNKVTTFDNCGNSGEIVLDGVKSASGKIVYVGGVAGNITQTSNVIYTGTNTNIGNFTVQNCTLNGTTAIGGVVGKTVTPVTGAQAYCDIKAVGLTGKVGMIMGIARATATLASGCGVGGSMTLTNGETGELDDNMNPIVDDIVIPLTADNYLQYVYGSTAAASSDEASFLNSKPSVTKPTAGN